jgi:hypothetical protein
MKYHPTSKIKGILFPARAQMDLEDTMLSKTNQAQTSNAKSQLDVKSKTVELIKAGLNIGFQELGQGWRWWSNEETLVEGTKFKL